MPDLRRPAPVLQLLATALLAAACSSPTLPNGEAAADKKATVQVFGAASLTDAFEELDAAFEAADPRYEVELNLAGSTGLRAQILDGAPVDVFASANEAIMDEVVDGLATGDDSILRPQVFATNRLSIAVPAGNPAGVTGLADFGRSDLFLGLCAETVPCGSFADQALAAAATTPSIDTREANVRALLTKVETGELDAGIVYASDVLASPEVEAIVIPDAVNPTARYPVAALGRGDAPDGGRAFVSFLLSEDGQQILGHHGFGAP